MTDNFNKRTALGFSIGVLIFSGLVFGWGWEKSTSDFGGRRESSGLILLFALPLLMQFGGFLYLCLRPLKSVRSGGFFYLYWGTLLLCATLNYGFWIRYLSITHTENQAVPDLETVQRLSHLCLIGIAVLLLIISLVTLAFMTPLDEDGSDDGRFRRCLESIKIGASRRPFWTLLHSMSVFLTVAYLFGFAFAFHDLTVPLPKKNAASQNLAPVGREAAPPATSQGKVGASQMPPLYMANLPNYDKDQPRLSAQDDDESRCANFEFDEASADLDRFGEGEDFDNEVLEKHEIQLKGKDKEKAERSSINKRQMGLAVARIIKLTGNGQQAHVRLLGHASSEPPRSGPYENNYELSMARVIRVEMELKAEVRRMNGGQWANVEWDPIPLSSAEFPHERDFMEDVCRPKTADEKIVNVYITSVADHPFHHWWKRFKSDDYTRLTLLDHMYFSMYTITTTGYGDIVPTTNYAKLLTCLANICEVFFIVGFFNSLMALKGKDQ